MPPDQNRYEQLEQLIDDAYELKIELQEQIGVAHDPVEARNLRLKLRNTKANIKELEAEYESLGGLSKNGSILTCPKPLPAPEHFAGRDKELAELKRKLKSDKLVALTSLNGQGGIGKTTLARQLAHDLYYEKEGDKVFRAVLWVEFTRYPDEGRILEKLGQHADENLSRAPNEEIEAFARRVKQTLQTAIEGECAECGPNRMLLVLDDVWENGLPIVRHLQSWLNLDNLTTLITSRAVMVATRLGIGRGDNQALTHLSPEAGATLLQEYLPDAPPEALLELAKVLGGYTLALKIAATRLVPASNLTRALRIQTEQYRQKLLAGNAFADLQLGTDKEENLSVALSHSYDELPPEQKARFRAFGVLAHDQPFDLPLMMALWQSGADETEEQAERFFQLALLEPAPETGEGWYKLHPVLHSYARALLKAALDAQWLHYYEDFIIDITEQFYRLQPENWGQLTPYLPHIHAVGASLVEQAKAEDATEEVLKRAQLFAINTSHYLWRRREVHQDEWLEMGLSVSRRLQDQKQEARFLSELGLLYDNLGDKTKALEYYNQALPLQRAVGDKSGEAVTLSNIGMVYKDVGEQSKAIEFFNQALLLQKEVGDKNGEATTLNNIGAVYNDLGEQSKALEFYNQALPLLMAMGNKSVEAITLNNIGLVYANLDNQSKALEFYKQALTLLRMVGDKGVEAITLTNIGLVYSDLGEKSQALDYYNQALPLQRAVGDRYGEATTCWNIGMVYESLRQLKEAVRYVARCVELDEQVRHPNLERDREYLQGLRAKLAQSQSSE